MYTNYITDSCFVPKECLSLLLLSSSFFFYCILYIPLSLPPSLLIFIISERKHKKRGEWKGRGKNLRHNPHFVFSIPFPSSRGNDTSPIEGGNVFNTRSRSNQKTSKSSVFPQFIAIISQLFLLFINCNKHRTPFFLLSSSPPDSIASLQFPVTFQLLSSTFYLHLRPQSLEPFVSLTQKLFLPPFLPLPPVNFILSFSAFLQLAAPSANFNTRKELSVAI